MMSAGTAAGTGTDRSGTTESRTDQSGTRSTRDKASRGRRYGGADAAERRDRRRRALISAGLDVFGTHGYVGASVKSVCECAGLTQRYFYESFTDRSDLLVAVYEDCVDAARTATLSAAAQFLGSPPGTEGPLPAGPGSHGVAPEDVPSAVRAALGAFLASLADDPRRARVMLVEVVGVSPEIERVRMRAIHGWAEVILSLALGTRTSTSRQRLTSVGLVGAVTQLLVDWYVASSETGSPTIASGAVSGAGEAPVTEPRPHDDDLREILDVCVELFTAAHQRLLS